MCRLQRPKETQEDGFGSATDMTSTQNRYDWHARERHRRKIARRIKSKSFNAKN